MGVWDLKTDGKSVYQFIKVPVTENTIKVQVQASTDAHIALTTGPHEGEPMYEVFIGGWQNSKTVIRKNRTKPDVAEVETPEILSSKESRGFWIWWDGNTLTVGGDLSAKSLLSYTDPEPIMVGCVGVRTGPGVHGDWKVSMLEQVVLSKEPEIWCKSVDGMIPSGAVECGNDLDGSLYVGRAHHESALIPGKINPEHKVCYITWAGEEHAKSEYEVLCSCSSTWVATSGDNIPPNAIPAGGSEDGEILYVGRVNHEGTIIIGNVQPSQKVLHISFDGKVVPFPKYEILTY